MEAHIKEHPGWFHRFDVSWTPTVLIMDSTGTERFRIEGYLPKVEFRAHLELGLARLAFKKKEWSDAEKKYAEVLGRYPDFSVAAEARYWIGVSQYQRTHDPKFLVQTARDMMEKFPQSVWTMRTSVWAGE